MPRAAALRRHYSLKFCIGGAAVIWFDGNFSFVKIPYVRLAKLKHQFQVAFRYFILC